MSDLKTEADIQAKIQIELSNLGVPMFRNNTGAYTTETGHYVRFGVGGVGGSDLIGITPVKITEDMVGQTLGVFTAIEVKSKNGRATLEQRKFIQAVKNNHGLAGVAKSVNAALNIIKRK